MPIMLELRPEIEERVLAQAQAQGVSPERYLAGVIGARWRRSNRRKRSS